MKIVLWSATWCAPCRIVKPQIAALLASAPSVGAFDFSICDVDTEAEAAEAAGVRTVPTLTIVVTDGTEARYIGAAGLVDWLRARLAPKEL